MDKTLYLLSESWPFAGDSSATFLRPGNEAFYSGREIAASSLTSFSTVEPGYSLKQEEAVRPRVSPGCVEAKIFLTENDK